MNDDGLSAIVAMFLLATVIGIACLFAHQSGHNCIKQEAVDHGYGRWAVLKGTDDTEFQWEEMIPSNMPVFMEMEQRLTNEVK